MNGCNISRDKNIDIKINQSNSILQNIKSNYFIEKIYDIIIKKYKIE